MNPDHIFAVLCMHFIFTAAVIVLFVQKYALLCRQIRLMVRQHNDLCQRFGLFMINGGQEVTKKHANAGWKEAMPPVTHESCSAVQGGCVPSPLYLEDEDTSAALPPFVQTIHSSPKPEPLPEGTHVE